MLSKSGLQAMCRQWMSVMPTDTSTLIVAILDSHLQAVAENVRLRARAHWMLHNGGLWCVEWPKEWKPSQHPPLLQWLSERIDKVVAAELVKEKNDGSTDQG